MGPFGPKTGPKPRNWNRNATAVSFKNQPTSWGRKDCGPIHFIPSACAVSRLDAFGVSRAESPRYPKEYISGNHPTSKVGTLGTLSISSMQKKTVRSSVQNHDSFGGYVSPRVCGNQPSPVPFGTPITAVAEDIPAGRGQRHSALVVQSPVLTMQVARGVDTAAK